MNTETIEADYLVIGAGAMGMAFTDVILNETQASVVLVDRNHQPGGHWTVAYPYVRLHQPSAFYGVNSRPLGSDTIDQTGWNKGLYELATNSEVVAYFDQVMQQQFLPSGRVQYLPNCHYEGDGRARSLISEQRYNISAHKVVDATYMHVTVPAIRPPQYTVAEGVACEPPNALPRLQGQYQRYVVVGAGKTGMDACLFLLKNQVNPDHITWIMPRDSWILDRANIQPGALFANSIGESFARQTQTLAQAQSLAEVFTELEAQGNLIRLDPDITPTMYRCATVTQMELEQLRRIKNVVRKGRVTAIDPDNIHLDQGKVPTDASTLHVDCTADGLERRPARPVFDGHNITLQTVRTCQQVFSGAFIAHIEAAYQDEAQKNDLCTPVPHPDTAEDFLHTSLGNSLNAVRWAQDEDLSAWLLAARLDGFTSSDAPPPDPAQLARLGEATQLAIENMQRLVADLN